MAWESLQNNTILFWGHVIWQKFVYLFPSILYSALYGRRVIICTSGIALQEQLFYKDAPLIANIVQTLINKSPKIVYLKGRKNFLCKRKLSEYLFAEQNSLNSFEKDNEIKEIKEIKEWAQSTLSGDMSELTFQPSYDVWQNFACVDNNECRGVQCDYFEECFYMSAKNACKHADVIITNYHILFSDISTGFKVLPHYDISVCDEAHNMANIARNFRELKVSFYTFANFRRQIIELTNKYEVFDRQATGIDYIVQKAQLYFQSITNQLQVKQDNVLTLTSQSLVRNL